MPENESQLHWHPSMPEEREWGDGHFSLEFRWAIYEILATQKVNFYEEAISKALSLTELTEQDVIADIGCNSGQRFIKAIQAKNIASQLVGLDPYDKAYEDWIKSQSFISHPKFSFIKSYAENLPLSDSSLKLGLGVFSYYEIDEENLLRAINETVRTIEPGGLMIFASNSKNNKPGQREDERVLAESLGLSYMKIPAKTFFAEDVPSIIDQVDGVEILDDGFGPDSVSQQGEILWTLDSWIIYYMNLYSKHYLYRDAVELRYWRNAIEAVIYPRFLSRINDRSASGYSVDRDSFDYGIDKPDRRLIVCRITK